MFRHSFSSTQDQDIASSSSESLHFMMEQERTTYSCYDYCNNDGDRNGDICNDDSTCSCSSATIYSCQLLHKEIATHADRMKLTDWCYTIVGRHRLQRETVAITMNIVDRFAGAPRASSVGCQEVEAAYARTEYQLVTVAALYIAVKMNERTIFGSQDFAEACRGMYSVEDIEGMELKILHALSWRLCPPTSLQVANQILLLMLSEDAHAKFEPGTLNLLREVVAVQTENAVRDYYFSTQRPSTVAAAAIMNAIESVCDWDCECVTEALMRVVGRFPFESYAMLLGARNRLLRLVNEGDVEENSTAVVSEGSGVPLPEEESQNASTGEETLDFSDYHTYHNLVRDSLEETTPSPRAVACDGAWDDNSCATVY